GQLVPDLLAGGRRRDEKRVGNLAVGAACGDERGHVSLLGREALTIRRRGDRIAPGAQIQASPPRQACDRVAYTHPTDLTRPPVGLASTCRGGLTVVAAHEGFGRPETRVRLAWSHTVTRPQLGNGEPPR